MLAALVLSENLEMKNYGPHSRPTDSETLGVRSRNQCFHELSKMFRHMLKFKDLWFKSISHKKEKLGIGAKKSESKHRKSLI